MLIQKLTAVIVVALMLAGCSKELTEQELLESAKDHLDKSEYYSASIQLKNALQKNPQQSEARWLLANVHLEMGNQENAEKELLRARELGVADESIRPLLARVYSEQSKLEEVLALQTDGLSALAQAQILSAQAAALLAQNRLDLLDQVEQKITQALALEPNLASAVTVQARLEFVKKDLQQARVLLETLLSKQASYAPAWSLLSEIERADGKPEAVEVALTRAIDNRYNNIADRLKRALVRIELKKYEEAQADVDELKKRMPGYYEISYAQGLLDFHQRNLPQARASLEAAVNANDQFTPALFYLGVVYFELDLIEQAENIASRFVAASPQYVPGRKLLAQIRLKERRFGDVEQLMRPVVKSIPDDWEALNMLAIALVQQKKLPEGLALLNKLHELRPESAEVRLRLGAALLLQGNVSQGMAMIKAAADLDPKLADSGSELVIHHYLEKREFDEAMIYAEKYQQSSPKSAMPQNLLGAIHLAKGDTKMAREAFDRARKLEAGNVVANQALASIAVNEKRYDDARAAYNETLKHHANHLGMLLKLAQLDVVQGRESELVKHLGEAIAAHPQAVEPRIMLARHHLAKQEPAKVATALGALLQNNFNNPDVVMVAGQAQLAQRATAEAVATFGRLVELQPRSAQAHYLLGVAYAQQDNIKSLKSQLQKSISLDKNYLEARLALTRLLILQEDKVAARQQLELLKSISPNHPDVMRLDGRMARAIGQQDKALNIYTELFERKASTLTLVDLAQQKWDMNDRKGAIVLLEQWISENPKDVAAHLQLASAYGSTDNAGAALKQYRVALELDPGNVTALNNLAWSMRATDPAQGLKHAEKASSLAPDSAVVADTLAMMLMYNDQIERALRINQGLMEKHPKNPTFSYHSAMILAQSGRNDEALTVLKKLLATDVTFSERKDAESLLAKLKKG